MASYLPLLLSSVSSQHIINDDTSLSTQARGQVDYLSHEWNEEDVARSWRNMTRQKNEIANGPRLENASWRTWWKQRNKLKTISPETLNWLKDSDVTWLYGPLHTAIDWSPPPKPKADPTSVDKDERRPEDRLNLAVGLGVKPILKHRTIGELLTSALPTSHDDYTANFEDGFIEDANANADRPLIVQTKSDTNVLKWNRDQNNPVRKQSPPRIVAETSQVPSVEPSATPSPQFEHPPGLPHSNSSDSGNGSSTDLAARANKRHITFNTFVEQCIAIDSPANKEKKKPSPDGRWAQYEDYDHDDGYDEDSEAGFNDLDDGTMFSDHETDDDDEPQLEIQTAAARARTAAQVYIHQPPPYPHHRVIAPTFKPKPKKRGSSSSSSREDHVTIAPIAPTMLKTIGVGNHFLGVDEQSNLVYMPPERSGGSGHSSPARVLSSEDVYRHREARWAVNGNHAGSSSSTSSSRSPHRPLVASPPSDDELAGVPTAIAQAAPMPYGPSSPGAGLLLKPGALPNGAESSSDELTTSLPSNGRDYFGSAASTASPIFRHPSHEDLVDIDVQEVETYQPPSEEEAPHSPPKPSPVTTNLPQPSVSVIIDEPSPRVGRERSRSRSRSRSHSRTPSPADLALEHSRRDNLSSAPVSIPRRANSHEVLLSPDRAGAPIARSYSMDGAGSGGERGRARDKSALSDRERSASRTPGTGSPFGSVSPTGIAGPAAYSGAGRKRAREEGEGANGRGRRRTDSNDSSGSTTSSQAASSVSPVGRSPGPGAAGDMRSLDAGVEESRRGSVPAPVKVPPTIGEEDEVCSAGGSRAATPRAGEVTPTPFNSPAKAVEVPKITAGSNAALSPVLTSPVAAPVSPTAATPTSPTSTTPAIAPTSAPKNTSPNPKRMYPTPASPTTATFTKPAKRERTSSSESVQSGSESETPSSPTLVGRAAHAAKGLLGSIW